MYKKTKLVNGLRVITRSMPKMQSVAIGIWIRVGARYENAQNKGISHYLEHLLFKGTKKYSLRKLKESIEGIGGSLNGFTSEETTCYLVKLPHRHIDLGLDVLSDMVVNPLIPEDEVEKERTVILEELKMYRDHPQSYVHDLLDGLLWPGQIMGMSVIGTVDSINATTREGLYSYKAKNYTPFNIVVSAAGVLDHESFTKKTQRIFSRLKSKSVNKFIKAQEFDTGAKVKILPKETEQTHLVMGFHAFYRDHPAKYTQTLLHIILGGNMSSRLFNEVREKKGLAYEIGTQLKRFDDTGAFIVHAGIDNHKVHQAIEVILKELSKIRQKPVTLDELKRAKEFYLGQLELAMEDTVDNMLWIGESTVMLNKVHTLEEIIKEINKIKREDIQEAARYIFKQNKINLAMIGPSKDKEEELVSHLTIG